MPITEIFPNPMVKLVAFEAKFPNLFFLESKIGDLQIKLMDRFPESSLLHRQTFIFTGIMPGAPASDNQLANPDEASGSKVWQFRSLQNCIVEIQSNSIVIQSSFHKTYNNPQSDDRFRDSIKLVMDAFFEVTRIPLLTRIGLRYIDECPLPQKENGAFSSYYNSTFPITRFSLADAIEMDFKTVVKRGNSFVRYAESLQRSEGDSFKFILDFDGFQERVSSDQYLAVTDNLHDLISKEFEASINAPVYEFMRKKKES